MEDILIPIFICVVLPVAIVWIVGRTKQNETNRKAEIMLKAIEAGVPVDMDQFSTEKKAPKTVKQDLLDKLSGACITSLMGLAFLVLAFIRVFNPEFCGEIFMGKLLLPAGCVLLAVGVGLFITYFAGKKLMEKEIEESK